MRLIGPVVSAILLARVVYADGWEIRAGIGNDALNGFVSRSDDNGFTNDFRLALRRREGDWALGGSILDRMITSSEVMQRSDLVELFATATWLPNALVALQLRAGPTFVGGLGGLWVQTHWHRISNMGPRDPRKVPTLYTHDVRTAGVVGLRADTSYGGHIRIYGALDGQVALGDTGVTFAEGTSGLRVSYGIGPVELGVFGELALGRYSVDDLALEVPGAYRPAWQLDRRLGVGVRVNRYRLIAEYHTNETSSGEAFSQITFERR
ncbi:MAG: hypothetical protein SFX73_03245 [Kofleriaceae bacterium]|nr:hypothetical protein [Kofleriaceae bacterium]